MKGLREDAIDCRWTALLSGPQFDLQAAFGCDVATAGRTLTFDAEKLTGKHALDIPIEELPIVADPFSAR